MLASVVDLSVEERVSIRGNGGRLKMSDFKLRELEEALKRTVSEVVLVQPNLTPSQIIAIMRRTKAEVMDRTALLLRVFEKNAGSREAKLQIEMARHKHELPLLREMLNRSKRGELPGFMAGGTYAIDKYYRQVRKELAESRRELEEMRERRAALRERRREIGLPTVAIVGYANAGKTTLFNSMTGERKLVGPTPFTTLSPKVSRHRRLPILLADTVGFVLNVPPEIVEAFYGTLEEIRESAAAIFTVDLSEDLEVIREQVFQASATLANLESLYKPMIIAANKIDAVERSQREERVEYVTSLADKLFPNRLGVYPISARRGEGLAEVESALWLALSRKRVCSG